jgi:hypothetical protein
MGLHSGTTVMANGVMRPVGSEYAAKQRTSVNALTLCDGMEATAARLHGQGDL